MTDTLDWMCDIPAAITVTDEDGTIIAMNPVACEVFAKEGGKSLIGRNVLDCHPEAARDRIKAIIETGIPNHYTISKRGQRKIIHQFPRFRSGKFAGLVEISVPIPSDMPHFDRDAPKRA